MRAGWLTLAVAVLLTGCDARAGVASIGSQDLPSPVSYRVTGTVTVGTGPAGVAVDPSTHTVFVANSGDGTVSVIDAATRTVIASIPVGEKPSAVAVDPGTHTVFVQHSGVRHSEDGQVSVIDGSVSVIDSLTRTVIATVPVGKGFAPRGGLAVDPATHTVYVANANHHTFVADDTLSVIDGQTYAVIDTVPVGAELTGVAVDPGISSVYVITEKGGTGGNVRPVGEHLVRVIDGLSRVVIATIPAGVGPRAVAVDPSTHDVYVANFWARDITVIDGSARSVVAAVSVDAGIDGVPGFGVDPSTHTVYVTTYDNKGIAVLDGSTRVVTATVNIDKGPSGLAVDPITHAVYVAADDGTVSIIENGP